MVKEEAAATGFDVSQLGDESKADRFKRIASRRTQNALEAIRRLTHCANHTSYEYTEEQAKKILDAVIAAVHDLERRFEPQEQRESFEV